MNRRRILIVVLVAAVVGGLGWLAFGPSNRPDPIYRGKPLSKWLEGYDSFSYPVLLNPRPSPSLISKFGSTSLAGPGPGSLEWLAANEALNHFGTNAIPTITWMLLKRDPAWRLKLLQLLGKQHVVGVRYTYASHWNRIGVAALESLGPSGASALPVLCQVYEHSLSIPVVVPDHDYPILSMTLRLPLVLAKMSPGSQDAIPSLLKGSTLTGGLARAAALGALGQIHSDPATVIPVLTNALRDSDPMVRSCAVTALGNFGKDAEPSIPAIVGMLADPDHWVRMSTLSTLTVLHPNPDVAVPALVKALEHSRDSNEDVNIMGTLRTFGPDAKPAVPAMIEALEREQNKSFRSIMRAFIEEIEAGAVSKAGVQ